MPAMNDNQIQYPDQQIDEERREMLKEFFDRRKRGEEQKMQPLIDEKKRLEAQDAFEERIQKLRKAAR